MSLKDLDGTQNLELRLPRWLPETQRQRIEDFLQGAVYCWCKNRKDEWFALRDLCGGDNTDWEVTPMQAIYDHHHHDLKKAHQHAAEAAAKDAGWLLKSVLSEDPERVFVTKKMGLVRHYRWEPDQSSHAA